MTHFVYLISMDAPNRLLRSYRKIGHARDSLNRLSGNQTGNPLPLILLRSIEFENKEKAMRFESACHRQFADYRVLNEWFRISDFDFDHFLEQHLADQAEKFERDLRMEAREVELAAEMRAAAEARVKKMLTGAVGRIHRQQVLGYKST